MKKLIGGAFLVSFVSALALLAVLNILAPQQAKVLGKGGKFGSCTTIQDGTLLTTDGRIVEPGYDEWGYNYQSRIFNGGYCDAYRDADWCQPYKDIELIMKWNDAWLSNKDCSDDRELDRYYGYASYIGSGAWLTNHQYGSYLGDDGKEHNWTYFVKIVAAPEGAESEEGVWSDADGNEIGQVIWGEFAVIESIYNDPYGGAHGVEYLSPAGPGFGKWK